MEKQLEVAIRELLDQAGDLGVRPKGDGTYVVRLAPERAGLSNREIASILDWDNPWDGLDRWLDYHYWDQLDEVSEQVHQYLREKLTAKDGLFPDGLSPEQERAVFERQNAVLTFEQPADYILKQEVCVNIMVDTGDGNYDFVNNAVYKESTWGKWQTMLATKAAVTWLAKTQGYTRLRLRLEMFCKPPVSYDLLEHVGFLKSMQKELLNLSTEFSILVFPVRMPLGQLLDLNRCIALQDRNGYHYDASENPYCGYLDLDKSVPVGLCDPFGGSGSLFEIELERDIRLPIRYIFSALPDGTHPNSCPLAKVYGVNEDFWAPAAKVVKGLRMPKKLLENEKKGEVKPL